jgi:hypothetical protein
MHRYMSQVANVFANLCFSETGQDTHWYSVRFSSEISTTKVSVHMILNHSTACLIFNYKLCDKCIPNPSLFFTHAEIRNHATLNSFDEYGLVIFLCQENLCLTLEFRRIYDILVYCHFCWHGDMWGRLRIFHGCSLNFMDVCEIL